MDSLLQMVHAQLTQKCILLVVTDIGGSLTVGGGIKCPNITAGHGQFGSTGAPFKFFDIPHPSKEFPHRLRYSCLEGPEIGVYLRGVLQGTNEIELTILLERSCR